MDILGIIIAGVLSLGGVLLGYWLSSRQQSKTRRIEYARDALKRARSYADRMEISARGVLYVLVGLEIGLPKSDKRVIQHSLDQVHRQLLEDPWLPEFSDEKIDKAWEDVSRRFGELFSTFAQVSPELKKKPVVRGIPPTEIRELLEYIKAGNTAALSARVAPDPETQLIYQSVVALLESTRALREEIKRAATE